MLFHTSHPITPGCSGPSFTVEACFRANFAEINREKSLPQDYGHKACGHKATDGVRPGKRRLLTCVLLAISGGYPRAAYRRAHWNDGRWSFSAPYIES